MSEEFLISSFPTYFEHLTCNLHGLELLINVQVLYRKNASKKVKFFQLNQ